MGLTTVARLVALEGSLHCTMIVAIGHYHNHLFAAMKSKQVNTSVKVYEKIHTYFFPVM